jgi:hypothetical protein
MTSASSTPSGQPRGARPPLLGPLITATERPAGETASAFEPLPPLRTSAAAPAYAGLPVPEEEPLVEVVTSSAEPPPIDDLPWLGSSPPPAGDAHDSPHHGAAAPLDDDRDAQTADEYPPVGLTEIGSEEEVPFIDLETLAALDPDPPALPHLPGQDPLERGNAEEMAERLERLARSLRQRGATGPLTEAGSDPLGALITGYLLGLDQARGAPEGGAPGSSG